MEQGKSVERDPNLIHENALMAHVRLRQLFRAVEDTSTILILPHNDPDPDAIASAIALRHLLQERLNVESTIVYRGIVGRAENRAMVRYRGLSRGVGPADAAAYFYLQPRVDTQALAQIEYAQVPVSYFKSFDATLRAARVYDGVVVAYVGPMAYPDLTAEMAHLLLRPEKSRWVVCMGVHRKVLILSVRTQSPTGGADQVATILPPLPAFDGLVRGAFLAKLVTTAVFFQPQKEVWDS